MTREWDEFVARVFDVVAPGTVLLILILGSVAVGALWYWFPAWVPRRLPRWRLRLPRWRRKPRAEKTAELPLVVLPEALADEVPEPAPVPGLSLADRLAAEGRFDEAIRQRLREILIDLIQRRLIPSQPGWTAAELAGMASAERPAVAWPLGSATDLFSEVWYGRRPAGKDQDDHMRTLTDQVRAGL